MNELEKFNQFKEEKIREANKKQQEANQYKAKLEQLKWEEKLSKLAQFSFNDNNKKKLASDLLKARVPQGSSLERIESELSRIESELGNDNHSHVNQKTSPPPQQESMQEKIKKEIERITHKG